MSNVIYHQFGESQRNNASQLFSEKNVKKTMKDRRMETNRLYRFEHLAKQKIGRISSAMESGMSKGKHQLLRFFHIEEVNEHEITIQVQTVNGQTLDLLTGEYCTQKALKHLNYALEYTKANFGEPISWNFKGDDIVRTPLQPHPTKVKDKVLDYFGLY